MAYVEKYYISYCDDFNTSRRVSILQKDYQGAINLLSSSTDISAVDWVKTQVETDGTRLVATNSNSPHWITQTITKEASAVDYNAYVDVTPAEYSRLYLRITDGNNDSIIAYFNTSSNTFTNVQVEAPFINLGLTSENLGSGTYRIRLNFTSSNSTELDFVVGIVDDNNDYIFAGDNLNGVNLSGIHINNIELKSGNDATELLADINPINITYDSSEDFKFSPIRASIAEVFMIFNSEAGVDFEEFWTADEKEFKIQDIKDGVVEWSGYVIPGGFQYEFKGGLYYASLEASDGLGTLESLTFVDDNQKPYGNQDLAYNNGFEFPFSLIITEILKKLELDLDLWTCVDSYERSMTKTGDVRDADPLSASFVNVKTYIKADEDETIPYWYGSGEEWNCKDVLENVLYIFGAKLYQEFGVWRVKSINSDVDYGTGTTQRYWRKYNTAGTYLFDYETVNDEINIPCGDKTKYLVENDHVMSMDDVYKAFRINYEYTFLRDGDTPLNLIKNGDFLIFDDTSVLSAPKFWERIVRNSRLDDYIRIRSASIDNPNDVNGYTKSIELGVQKNGTSIEGTTPTMNSNTGLLFSDKVSVKSGDSLFFEVWNYYKYKILSGGIDPQNIRGTYTMMYRLVLLSDDGNKYYLRNGSVDLNGDGTGDSNDGFIWQQSDDSSDNLFEDTSCFYLLAKTASNYDASNDTIPFWYNHKYDLPDAPSSGNLSFIIHGLSVGFTTRGGDFLKYPTWTLQNGSFQKSDYWRVSAQISDTITNPQVTGVFLGLIPSGNELPNQQDYIYNNINTNYTLQVDPITIYNGDTQDAKHISNIIVPSNVSGDKNFWDDLSDAYGISSLGLLTTKQIMRQYAKPYRILEGTLKIQDGRFGSIYTFETIPNVRFSLLRGRINKQKQYIEDATFVQITDDSLPSGGTEGGNVLDPNWTPTGNTYCRVGEDALNDGFVIIEEIDINPNSETYQDTREVVSDNQDLTQCPLNQPRLYYWSSDDVYLNLDTMSFSPFTQVSTKEIEVSFSNDEGNYIYFVHLKSLGSVERIYTLTSPNNVISDWVYLADVIIDGYIYRVLRTDYVMTEFSNFTHNLKFA